MVVLLARMMPVGGCIGIGLMMIPLELGYRLVGYRLLVVELTAVRQHTEVDNETPVSSLADLSAPLVEWMSMDFDSHLDDTFRQPVRPK